MTRGRGLALAVFVLVLLSRSPFAAHSLWAHDSALYAAALESGFHVDDALSQQRPHPPGYLFYVVAAGAARSLGLGSNEALVLVSAVASALAAAGIFLLARRWVREAVALVAALAFAADPLVWEYSEIAYPYTTLALGSIAVAAVCLRARGHGTRAALGASVVFGVACGFRQDLLLLLGPLWWWTVAPLGTRGVLVACAALAATCLTWLVPSAALSGGLGEYVSAVSGQVDYVRATYSVEMRGAPALLSNAAATSWALAWALGPMLPLAVAGAVGAARGRASERDRFLLLWTMPALAVYLAVHIGDSGYVLSVVPGFYVFGGRALDAIVTAVPRRGATALATAALAMLVAPAYAFVFGSVAFGAAAISAHDTELMARVTYVREQFPVRSTLILTREDFLLVRYYLPEYRSRQYDPEPFTRAYRRMRTGRVERIVVFTPGLVPDQRMDVRSVRCRDGIEFVYLDVMPGSVLEFRGERYAIASPAP